MAVLGIVAATVMVSSLNASALRNDQDRKTTYALAQAKQALIGRAASDSQRPGSLPCPDAVTNIVVGGVPINVPNDGIADMLAGNDCPSYVGRLPWKTLGLPDLRDADGERLWYVLSSNFRDDNSATINSTTQGTITVTGTIAATNAAAVVFSAGAPLANQNRSGANINTATHYLDGGNGAATTAFQSQAPGSTFNDRLMVVLSVDLSNIVQKRVGKEIASALDTYYADAASGSKLPYAADPTACLSGPAACVESPSLLSGRIPARPITATTAYATSILGDTPTSANSWFNNNGWRQLIQYAVSADCATTGGCKSGGGGFTVNTTGSGSPTDSKVTLTLDTVTSTGSLVAKTQNLQ
jgi:hypothetical protein